MAKTSKYIKVDKNVLLEWVYDNNNLISEPYNILVNSKDRKNSYLAYQSSTTNNSQSNQLFNIDPIQNKWGKLNIDYYNFLQLKNYSSSNPIQHDKLIFHVPVNWTFDEYYGFYVKIYTYDSSKNKKYELSNFYFDITDISQENLLNYSSPQLLFQEQLWGKNIELNIPSVDSVASQLDNGLPASNSINETLTNGVGLSLNSPIFIDFYFIKNIETIGGITTYTLESKTTTSVPQTPEFKRLGLKIENSPDGDYFEIFGTYNGNISEFNKFINDSLSLDKQYYVEFNITVFEENIRGKTTTITLTNNFNESVEYRPIIKHSTTTAVIDVEMRLIDAVDNSSILRRASYGMLQDQVSKYSLNLTKINLDNANKPKIYNIKNSIDPSLVGLSNPLGILTARDANPKQPKYPYQGINSSQQNIVDEVEIPVPVLIDRYNIMAKSENAILNDKTFFGNGKLQIMLYPFDNVVNFIVAKGDNNKPEYFDLTNFNDVKIVFKNDDLIVSSSIHDGTDNNDLSQGMISFKIEKNKYKKIKKILNSGINVFYITGLTSQNMEQVIYSGTFKLYDNAKNVDELNKAASKAGEIILDKSEVKPSAVVRSRTIDEDGGNKPKKKTKSRSISSDGINMSIDNNIIPGTGNISSDVDDSNIDDETESTQSNTEKYPTRPSTPTSADFGKIYIYEGNLYTARPSRTGIYWGYLGSA